MSKRLTTEYVKSQIKSYGFIPMFDKYFNNQSMLLCSTKEGYLFEVKYNSLRKDRMPLVFKYSNRFALENMNLWLEQNNKSIRVNKRYLKTFGNYEHQYVEYTCQVCGHKSGAKWTDVKRYRGCGCSKCRDIANGIRKRVPYDDCVKLLAETLPSINPHYEFYKDKEKWIRCTCKICGNEWDANWGRLKQGSGCNSCRISTFKSEIKSDDGSFVLAPYNLYIIRCFDENESFYKIGITNKTLHYRFTHNKMPYEYEVINFVNTNKRDAILIEQHLHKEHYHLKYKPLKHFSGHTECFNEIIEDVLEKYLKGVI